MAQISHFEHINYTCNYIPAPPRFSFRENKLANAPDRINAIHLKNLSLRAPPVCV